MAPIYLSLRQFAEQANLSPSTIRRLVRAGRIQFYQPSGPGGKLLFPCQAIEAAGDASDSKPATGESLSGRNPAWMD